MCVQGPRVPPLPGQHGVGQSRKQALLAQDPIPGVGGWQDGGKDQKLYQHVGGLPESWGDPEGHLELDWAGLASLPVGSS